MLMMNSVIGVIVVYGWFLLRWGWSFVDLWGEGGGIKGEVCLFVVNMCFFILYLDVGICVFKWWIGIKYIKFWKDGILFFIYFKYIFVEDCGLSIWGN